MINITLPIMNEEAKHQNYGNTFFTLYLQKLKILKKIPRENSNPKQIDYLGSRKENQKNFFKLPYNSEGKSLANVEFEVKKSNELRYDPVKKQFSLEKRVSLADHGYWIGLSIEKQKEKVQYIQYIFYRDRILLKESYTFNKDKLFEAVETLSRDVRKVLSGNESFFYFKSNPSGARVYLEGVYLGETPVEVPLLSQGEYQLKMMKKNFYPVERKINLQLSDPVLIENLREISTIGTLEIITSEPGMEIYVDNHYMGKTPKKIENLELKSLRVILKKEGFLEKNLRIVLDKSNPQKKIRVTIKKGNTVETWQNRQYFIRPITYDHMVKAHWILAGSAFLSYLYFLDRYDKKEDYLYSHYLNDPNLVSDPEVESIRNDLKTIQTHRNISFGVMIYGIVAGIYFYWKKIDSLDPFGSFVGNEREYNSVSFFSTMDDSGYFSAGYRFYY